MDMKTYLRQASPEERSALAAEVKSSVGYFYLLAGGHRHASTKLCQKLVSAEPKLTLQGLRPDIWGGATASSSSDLSRAHAPAPP